MSWRYRPEANQPSSTIRPTTTPKDISRVTVRSAPFALSYAPRTARPVIGPLPATRPHLGNPPRLSSVDEVLTLLRSDRDRRHRLAGLSGGEQRSRCAALQAITLMRPFPVVEAQVGLQIPLQLRHARVVGSPEGDPPQFAQDCALQPFDEAIGPRMPRFGAPMLDPQLATGQQEAPIELRPAIGQDGAHRMARPLVARHDVAPQKRRDRHLGHPWHERGDRVRAGRIAGRELPDLAHALELPYVEGIQADQIARPLDVA